MLPSATNTAIQFECDIEGASAT